MELSQLHTLANCSCLLTVLTGSWQLLSGLPGALGDTYTWFPIRSLLGACMSPKLLGTLRPLGLLGPLGPPGPLGPSGQSGLLVQLGQSGQSKQNSKFKK